MGSGKPNGCVQVSKRNVAQSDHDRRARVYLDQISEEPPPGFEDLRARERPKTRGDCIGGERPCPWVSCRHHLALEVGATLGVTLNQPGVEIEDMEETCSLDVADLGPLTLEQTAALFGLTRERIRQIEAKGIKRLKKRLPPGEAAELTEDEPLTRWGWG